MGTSVKLNDETLQVVGIVPPGQRLLRDAPEIWTLASHDPEQLPGRMKGPYRLMARLPETNHARAAVQLQALSSVFQEAAPRHNDGVRFTTAPLLDTLVQDYRHALILLQGAVFLLLLICVVNASGLFLADSVSRARETAVRLSLGGSWIRIYRDLLPEAALVGAAAGTLGILATHVALALVLPLLPDSLPRKDGILIDFPVLLFASVLCFGCVVLCSLGSALRLRRIDLTRALKEDGRALGSLRLVRAQRGLLVFQFALSTLLVGATLMIRTFGNLTAGDLGFEPNGVLSAGLQLPSHGYQGDKATAAAAIWRSALQHASELPAVEGPLQHASRPPVPAPDLGLPRRGGSLRR